MAVHIPARLFFLVVGFIVGAVPALGADDWKPVDPAHLALEAPVVEKDADAEAIFWEVHVDFSLGKTVFDNYIRIKIFTERGKERQSKIELPYGSKTKIEDIAARTIKPDGTIVQLSKDAIFDSTVAKARGIKINAKSFALPAVEPGAIIEYRWREVRHDSYVARLDFQMDIPVQLVRYTLKPPSEAFSGFRAKPFNMEAIPMETEKGRRVSYTMTKVAAFHEEALMPPENQVRPWMLAYYDPPMANFYGGFYEENKSRTTVNDEIKRAALAATGDASTPDQKLERLYQFCQTKIKNIRDESSGLTADNRANLKENKTAADTLRRRMGNSEDIDLLFVALATAAGFDARVSRVADRSTIFLDPSANGFLLNMYLMNSYNVAVRVGDDWRFFDPAGTNLPFGMLRWQEEGVKAMLVEPFIPSYVMTPVSPAEKSVEKRTANLRLREDGALEGAVRMEYTGHIAIEERQGNSDASAEQREKNLRDTIKEHMSTAELSNIRIENENDPTKPLVYSFYVRVPGYAQRTGKRLFLQPAFFEHGVPALFSAAERRHPIYFSYPWKESDAVIIALPTGFELERPEQPGPFHSGNIAAYEMKIFVLEKGEALQVKRTFSFEGLLFPAKSYPGLKELFDRLHEADNHTITLKQAETKQ